MATYIINTPGSGGATYPSNPIIGDILRFNHTSTGRTGTTFSWTGMPYTGDVKITCVGASGGSIGGANGGYGAKLVSKLTITAGTHLRVLAGTYRDGYNGYGSGGGASGVWVNGAAQPLIIAGAGGGSIDRSGGAFRGKNASLSTSGTAGGSGVYAGGINGLGGNAEASSGGQSGAGWLGNGAGGSGASPTAPVALKNGANGGQDYTVEYIGSFGGGGGGFGGGGGGGGYSGGGAGGSDATYREGGGGGSYTSGESISIGLLETYKSPGYVEIELLAIPPACTGSIITTPRVSVAPIDIQGNYTEPKGNSMSHYRIDYRVVGAPSWQTTGWLSKVVLSGGNFLHSFAPLTFSASLSYEVIISVRSSSTLLEANSSILTFTTEGLPYAIATQPKDLVKVNPKTSNTFTWSTSIPQAKYEIRYKKQVDVNWVSTGEITAVAVSHIFNENTFSGVGNPIYEYQIRIIDIYGQIGTWSSSILFTSFQPYEAIGTYEGAYNHVYTHARGSITWTETIPVGTSLGMEISQSNDGVVWTPWVATAKLGVVPGGYNKIRYRATFNSSADGLSTPSLDSVTVAYPDQYFGVGTWISPIKDYRDYEGGVNDIISVSTKAEGQEVVLYTRTSLDAVDWTEWELIGTTLPVGYMYVQYKAELTPEIVRETTPELTSIATTFTDFNARGVWISQVADVSQSTNLSDGRLLTVGSASHGKLIIESSSSADGGVTWSAWYPTLVDGTLVHPDGAHIKIKYIITNDAKVDEATLSMDGEAATTLLTSNLTANAQYDFTTLRDKLIIANGSDALRKWDGITANSELVAGDPPSMHILATHLNRVWGVDAENKSRVRYSDILDPETWGAFSFIDFNPEDGDEITAMMRYGQNLIVSKQRSMAILTGNKSTNFSVTWLDSEAGVSGKRGIISADKYVVYVAQDGIRFTDLATSVVATERMLPEWRTLNQRRLNQAALVYWKNCIYAALPSTTSLENDVVWAYDFLRNSWSIYEGWGISTWLKFQQYGEEHLLGANSKTGQIYTMHESTYDDELPVDYTWRSKDFHFEHPERYKLFRSVYLDIEGVSEASKIYVDMLVDGVKMGTYTANIEAGVGVKHTRRILPPLYNAVLGRTLTLEIKTRCGIQGISIEYVVRGAVPGGEL